jgi:protein-S-isoprenylcysteine O-methyltransferase Ste14
MMNSYILLVASWIAYFSIHSLMAIENFKKRFNPRTYRIVYSLIATIGLLFLLSLNGGIQAADFFESKGFIKYISLMLATFGVMVMQSSFKQYGLKSFLGLAAEKNQLREDGILKYIRHPIYAGIILISLGFFLFIPNLPTMISSICILTYLPIGIYLEEKKLVKYFGDLYIDYKKRVPSLIPRLF